MRKLNLVLDGWYFTVSLRTADKKSNGKMTYRMSTIDFTIGNTVCQHAEMMYFKKQTGEVNLMKKAKFSRYYLLLCLPVLLALVGLVWGRPTTVSAVFDTDDLNGRYVSAETAYDTSSVHNTSIGTDGGVVGPPIFYAATAVMEADGKGNVCGESDGFYSGITAPGVNLGPAYYHGKYTIDANGRITISICSDSAFCHTAGACGTVTTEWVGYLQSHNGITLATVGQIIPTSFSSGFLVHSHVWTRDPSDQNKY